MNYSVTAYLFLILIALSTHAASQTLFSQIPPNPDQQRISDFAASFTNQQAQQFSLTSDSSVAALRVWGIYQSGAPTDNFTIRFFTDSGTGPEINPFEEVTTATITRADSGLIAPASQIVYEYSINLPAPIALTSATTYYFSIVNNTTPAEEWQWTGTPGTLRWSRGSDSNPWSAVPVGVSDTELAFELLDTPITPPTPPTATPVPTLSAYGLAVTVLGLAILAARRLHSDRGRS